nr:MAG TPA: hypothetical protein [Caudoviricetes sp.]
MTYLKCIDLQEMEFSFLMNHLIWLNSLLQELYLPEKKVSYNRMVVIRLLINL